MSRAVLVALGALLALAHASVAEQQGSEVCARTTAGRVCGRRLLSTQGKEFASFRGVPYAKQPVGELRFQELQPLETWDHDLDAREEGPICPQTDVLYGPLMRPGPQSEACINLNIHAPLKALPHESNLSQEDNSTRGRLPILVFVHGGGFACGSGNSDVQGPEHLMDRDIIVVTFNYRLNVFGFLSLNTPKIPGNNGLRDIITLLRWVKSNAHYFGGNPNDVTLAGQSAGAAATHLLTLSPEASGLFNKAMIMSGTALPTFYTTTPAYAQYISNAFVGALGINSTDPDEIHDQLTKMPLDLIMLVNAAFQDESGLAVFFPVVESPLPGVKPILPADTDVLLARGYGKDIPLLIGFTNVECECFRKRFTEIDILSRIKHNPALVLSPTVLFSAPPNVIMERAMKVDQKYFAGSPTMDKYLKICTETFFQYPALKLAKYRSQTKGAPTYMYEFSFNSPSNPIRQALGLKFNGSAHVEDLAYLFQVNSVEVQPSRKDEYMTEIMLDYLVRFMQTGHPTNFAWRPITQGDVRMREIHSPSIRCNRKPTPSQEEMVTFYDDIFARS